MARTKQKNPQRNYVSPAIREHAKLQQYMLNRILFNLGLLARVRALRKQIGVPKRREETLEITIEDQRIKSSPSETILSSPSSPVTPETPPIIIID